MESFADILVQRIVLGMNLETLFLCIQILAPMTSNLLFGQDILKRKIISRGHRTCLEWYFSDLCLTIQELGNQLVTKALT